MIQWGFTHHLSHQLYQWEIITVPGSVSFHKFAMFIFWSVLSDWIQSFFWFLCYCNNAIVLLSGIIVYLLKKYIFYCFWNNLFDNLTSSCIVIVYRSEQQIKEQNLHNLFSANVSLHKKLWSFFFLKLNE